MSEEYHIRVFDNFHRGDWPDETWVIGRYATAEAAIAVVKELVDQELKHFWFEICRSERDHSTVNLISHYDSFAEIPVAFDSQGNQIFDTTAYMKTRAAEIITEAGAKYGAKPSP